MMLTLPQLLLPTCPQLDVLYDVQLPLATCCPPLPAASHALPAASRLMLQAHSWTCRMT